MNTDGIFVPIFLAGLLLFWIFDINGSEKSANIYKIDCQVVKKSDGSFSYEDCEYPSNRSYKLRVNRAEVVVQPQGFVFGITALRNCSIYDEKNWLCADRNYSRNLIGMVDGVALASKVGDKKWNISIGRWTYYYINIANFFKYQPRDIPRFFIDNQFFCSEVTQANQSNFWADRKAACFSLEGSLR